MVGLAQNMQTKLTLYFDGSCPLCLAEMRLLEHKDTAGLLKFEDITDSNFSEQAHGVLCEVSMKSIKGKTNTGELLDGIQVFARAYELVGMKKLAHFLAAPSLQGPLSWAYLKFAKYRHTFSKLFGPIALRLVNVYVQRKRP